MYGFVCFMCMEEYIKVKIAYHDKSKASQQRQCDHISSRENNAVSEVCLSDVTLLLER